LRFFATFLASVPFHSGNQHWLLASSHSWVKTSSGIFDRRHRQPKKKDQVEERDEKESKANSIKNFYLRDVRFLIKNWHVSHFHHVSNYPPRHYVTLRYSSLHLIQVISFQGFGHEIYPWNFWSIMVWWCLKWIMRNIIFLVKIEKWVVSFGHTHNWCIKTSP